MYPTRDVRHAAWDALDFLFPVRHYTSHVYFDSYSTRLFLLLSCSFEHSNLFLTIITGCTVPILMIELSHGRWAL